MASRHFQRAIREIAESLGFRLHGETRKHFKWKGPNGQLVVSSRTPSDWRSLQNTRADFRRAARSGAAR